MLGSSETETLENTNLIHYLCDCNEFQINIVKILSPASEEFRIETIPR